MGKKGLYFGLFGVCTIAGAGYAALYTPVPLSLIERKLAAQGAQVADLDGSLMDGWVIGSISFKDGNDQFSLTGLKVNAKGMEGVQFFAAMNGIILNKKLHVDAITLDGVSIESSGDPSSRIPKEKPKAIAEWQTGIKLEEIQIGLIKASNIIVKSPKSPKPQSLRELSFKNFLATPKSFKLEEIAMASKMGDLKVRGLRYEGDKFYMDEKLSGTVKVAAFPDYLRKDLTFSVKFQMPEKDKFDGEIALLDEKVKVAVKPDQSVTAEVRGLSPSEYVNLDLPVTDINLSMAAPNYMMAMFMTPSGSLKVRDAVFQTAPADPNANPLAAVAQGQPAGAAPGAPGKPVAAAPQPGAPAAPPSAGAGGPGTLVAYHDRGNARFTLTFSPKGGSPQGALTLTSNVAQGPQDNLAQLYHNTPYAKLDPARREQVDKDAVYFGGPALTTAPQPMAAGAAPGQPAAPAVAQAPQPQAANRAPAAAQPAGRPAPAPAAQAPKAPAPAPAAKPRGR